VPGRGIVAAAAVLSGALVAAAVAGTAGSAPSTQGSARVIVVPGTEDYAPGTIRVSFLLIDGRGAAVYRPGVRVSVAKGKSAKPFVSAVASIEAVGAPGTAADAGDVTKLYVVHLRIARPGSYTLVADAPGKTTYRGTLPIVVRARPVAPAVGSKAIPSQTPTIASTHGNLEALTTRTPPDTGLLRYSVAGSIAAHKPFVLVFATPKFCTSRTCGPVVDVVDAVRKQFARTGIRFIHVEVYDRNDPGRGYNRWFKAWHLPTEPWTFLVGADGRIKARFEGSVSVGELAGSVRRYLE
jgi:hypothetical protein